MEILLIIIAIAFIWTLFGVFSSRNEYAEYTVIKKTNDYEIREYKPLIVAQTTVQGSYKEALGQGFRIVAGYIFGGNTKKENISMTVPVTDQKIASEKIAMTVPVLATTAGESHVISFFMPRKYTLDTLPVPTDSRVKIVMNPARKCAAVKFGGWRFNFKIQQMERKLLASLARDGVAIKGSPIYAGYNAPWDAPWLMKNEVLVEIIN